MRRCGSLFNINPSSSSGEGGVGGSEVAVGVKIGGEYLFYTIKSNYILHNILNVNIYIYSMLTFYLNKFTSVEKQQFLRIQRNTLVEVFIFFCLMFYKKFI